MTSDPHRKSALFENFEVSATGIRPLREDLPPEVFLRAATEYLELTCHNGFKIGDLLRHFRAQYPDDVQHYMIRTLAKVEGENANNLIMQLSLADHFCESERYREVDQTHYREFQSVKDPTAKAEILEHVRGQLAAGQKVKALEVRKLAREAKMRTGQGIRSNRGNPRIDA